MKTCYILTFKNSPDKPIVFTKVSGCYKYLETMEDLLTGYNNRPITLRTMQTNLKTDGELHKYRRWTIIKRPLNPTANKQLTIN